MRKRNTHRYSVLPRRRASVDRLEPRVLLSAIVVNTTRDDGPFAVSSGLVSLRDAVTFANSGAAPPTITFDPKVFGVPRKITLNGNPLEIRNTRHSITITGPAAALTVENPNGDGVFLIDHGVQAVIGNLNIANSPDSGIINRGTLRFVNGAISDCAFVIGRAGGVDNSGTAILANDTFASNYGGSGGAIHNSGSLKVTDCTVSTNQASFGAGIYNEGSASLVNVTLTNNEATGGGGLYNSGSASLVNVTIANNAVGGSGGGIFNDRSASKTAAVTLANSIVAGNVLDYFDATHPDINGIVSSLGHNLIGQADGALGLASSDLSGSAAHPLDPRLLPLADNGGATKTMMPAGGPAIGGGLIALLPAGTTTDQRGKSRVTYGRLDIGAVQMSGPVSLVLAAPKAQSFLRFKPTAIELGSITSLSGDLPIAVVVNWGDGSADSIIHVTKLGTLSRLAHSFLISGALSVSVSATDSSAVSNLITFAVNVSDAPAVVTSLNFNASKGNGLLGLGDAIELVDQSKADATITFDFALFAKPRTIGIGDVGLSGHHTIAIDGPAAGVTLQGKSFSNGIGIAQDATADISGITVTGCEDSGVTNYGELHLSNSTISGNMGIAAGGIQNHGTMFLTDVTISGNRDGAQGGGGIFNDNNAIATLQNVNIFDNQSSFSGDVGGGGIRNLGTMTLVNVNISRNVAGIGGGIENENQITLTNVNVSTNASEVGAGLFNQYGGEVNLTNVSLSQNHATMLGGGAFNYGTLTFINSTIADNDLDGVSFNETFLGAGGGLLNEGRVTFNNVTVAGNTGGGGISNQYFGDGTPALFQMSNSIVADNTASALYGSYNDISGTIHSLGHNVIAQTDGSLGWTKSDLLGTDAHPLDPKLAPLGFYGQFTATMPPLPGSLAVDQGSNQLIPKGITTDQRGLPRISHGTVDIGAVELQQPQIVGLILVNARTGQTIMPLTGGATIDLSKIPRQLDVVAVLKDGVPGSVVFGFDGNSRFRIEKEAPFSLFGDVGGRYVPGTFAAGKHTITVQAYTDSAATQPVGKAFTIHFTVIDGSVVKSLVVGGGL